MTTRRVGIYNRWLSTLGGGEKYCLSIAERLSQTHHVEVLSPGATTCEQAEERLHLDLSRVTFIALDELTPEEMTSRTADYDLFINSSFMDFFPSLAPASANVVYFPARINWGVSAWRWMKLSARRYFAMPAVRTGIYRASGDGADFRWQVGARAVIDLPSAPRAYTLSISVKPTQAATLELVTTLDGQQVLHEKSLQPGRSSTFTLPVPASTDASPHRLVLQASGQGLAANQAVLEISGMSLSLPRFQLYQLFFGGWFKHLGGMLQYHPTPPAAILHSLDSYRAIWAISEFSRHWIRRYWRRESAVLYPPIRCQDFTPGEKRAQILSVGRFFSGQHNKKHLEMVAAFKRMVDHGLQGWELHLAGGATPGEEHAAHLERIRQATQGYPIFLHLDIPFSEMLQLYAQSAIYWHASGYGENEQREPVRFEHFGITTVEAMAAGCVPVVIGKGAQPEIVTHGVDGFLWRSLDELEELTSRLIRDEGLRQRLAGQARQTSLRYDRKHFDARLDELLTGIGFSS